ncbi:MAG: ATP-binding protein [Spirochaetota bacterium]
MATKLKKDEKPTARPHAIDFVTAKEIILKELSSIPVGNDKKTALPEIFPEKDEVKVQFYVEQISRSLLVESIQLLKNYLENIRIHTFESGFYSFQALNENIYDTKELLDNIRFRFINARTENKVEISKKGDYTRNEIFAIIAIFKLLRESHTQKLKNPKQLLQKLGVSVFDPAEAKKKGQSVGFEHVAGYEEVKEEIIESITMPLNHPEMYDEVSRLTKKFPGKNRPRAVLFEGEPGVGKTTMARIVSCLAKIPMIYVPIESIMSKYYGESAQNLAQIFDAASLFSSSIIFLDEIDSLAGNRDEGMIEATRKILSVLLRKLDGFEGNPKSLTIGATNRKQDLDRALVSRFDKSIYFPMPNLLERAAILGNYAIHLEDEEKKAISAYLDGMSGRNIKDYCDHVERKWATKILQEKRELEPPPFALYETTAKILMKG